MRRVCPTKRGRTRSHQPPDLFRSVLHYYYENVLGSIQSRENFRMGLSGTVAASTNRPSRDTIDQFHIDLEHVIEDVLDGTYAINSPHLKTIRYFDQGSWNFDPTVQEYYYGFGGMIAQPTQRFRLQRSSPMSNKLLKRR